MLAIKVLPPHFGAFAFASARWDAGACPVLYCQGSLYFGADCVPGVEDVAADFSTHLTLDLHAVMHLSTPNLALGGSPWRLWHAAVVSQYLPLVQGGSSASMRVGHKFPDHEPKPLLLERTTSNLRVTSAAGGKCPRRLVLRGQL